VPARQLNCGMKNELACHEDEGLSQSGTADRGGLVVPDDLSALAFKQADCPALAGVEHRHDQIWIGSTCRTKDDTLVILILYSVVYMFRIGAIHRSSPHHATQHHPVG
jgi:hypothetical protein